MRIRSTNSLGFGVAVLLSLVLSLSMVAKDRTPKMINIQGKVFMIDKDSSTIMVDTKSGARRLVVYSPDTKFKYGRSGKGKDVDANCLLDRKRVISTSPRRRLWPSATARCSAAWWHTWVITPRATAV